MLRTYKVMIFVIMVEVVGPLGVLQCLGVLQHLGFSVYRAE
jgi:hypothetical protein